MGDRTASARGRLVRAYRRDYPHTPDQFEDLQRDLAAAKIEDFVERVLASAPELRQEQKDHLAELLRPVRRGAKGGDDHVT